MPEAHILPFPVIVGDIGGTNARFAIVPSPDSEHVRLPTQRTAAHPSVEAALLAALGEWSGPPPASALFALAGPVLGDRIPLTNCPWVIDAQAVMKALDLSAFMAVNDFEGQALAAAALPEEDWIVLREGQAVSNSPRIILGPGTGLGVGGLIELPGLWVPVPGEGGHVDMGPRTADDLALWPHLHAQVGHRISGEAILCGRGLLNLYRAVSARRRTDPRHDRSEDITRAALAGEDSIAEETIRHFVTYLGRLAGDLALVYGARGGAYITGGIAPVILPFLRDKSFIDAFDDKAPHSAWLSTIPIHIVAHESPALAGLAAYAAEPDLYAVSQAGRFWSR
ncbi:glucokinase [Notoacmeibacter ruber]|uniref:Glucokinase n=2 Tax=Notoacmeibacter ruber TaxID=2670375 RepID=A0A3L7JFT0_9HYPH|nr:glucokinase [Notoacmeibacter ruber]